ncbi:MAG TPA: hypothetical protein VFZ61_08330, partial [Polyangiales bacterium]
MSKVHLYACAGLLLGALSACSDSDGAEPVDGAPPLGGGPSGVVVDAGSGATPPAAGADASAPSVATDSGAAGASLDAARDTSAPSPAPEAGPAQTSDAAVVTDAGQTDAGAGSCDRPCLLGSVQGYLDALIAHDPTKLKVSASVKYTDNGVAAKLGDGLWKSATALVKEARLDFADPSAGQVATMTVVNESTAPVIYMVRLKVVAGEITEIESMSVRR